MRALCEAATCFRLRPCLPRGSCWTATVSAGRAGEGGEDRGQRLLQIALPIGPGVGAGPVIVESAWDAQGDQAVVERDAHLVDLLLERVSQGTRVVWTRRSVARVDLERHPAQARCLCPGVVCLPVGVVQQPVAELVAGQTAVEKGRRRDRADDGEVM